MIVRESRLAQTLLGLHRKQTTWPVFWKVWKLCFSDLMIRRKKNVTVIMNGSKILTRKLSNRWDDQKKSKLGYRLSINCTHSTYILSRQAAVPSTIYKAKCLFINLFSSLKQRRVQAEVAQKFNEKSTYIIHCVLPSNNICTQHWFSKLL